MKVVVVGNQKGGVGKTTISTNLAVAAALDGKRVLIIDADTQGNSMGFRALRQTEGKNDISAVQITTPTVHKDISNFTSFDLVIVDAGGRDNPLFRSAVGSAAYGVLIVPVLPSQYDIWSTEDTFDILAEARVGAEIPAYALFNQILPNTIVARDAKEAIIEMSAKQNFGILQTSLVARQDYKKSISKGQGVIEFDSRGQAADEVRSLYREIKAILGEA